MNEGGYLSFLSKSLISSARLFSFREMKELTEMRSVASNSSHRSEESPLKSAGLSTSSSKQQFQTPVSRRQSRISLPVASLSAPQGDNISLSSPSFNESKESTPSSSSTEYVKVDQEFKDARDTIRFLSQKLSSSTGSSLPAPPK
jgi:hypothetical protein